MADAQDETMKLPGSHHDPAAAARARIAALTDAHLEGDHPLLRAPGSQAHEKPPKKAHKLAGHKLTSKVTRPHPSLPAEWVSNQRKVRPAPSKLRPVVNAVASFVLLLIIFKSAVIVSQVQYWLGAKQTAVTQTQPTEPVVSAAPVLDIPKIRVHAPTVYVPTIDEASIQKGLQSGVVHYATTSLPGQDGNTVFVGHSSNDWWEPGHYKFVFVLLDKMSVGDKFSINYNSKHYVYQVIRTKIVEPTDLSVLNPSPTPEVTLITCTPPGTSWRRLVVIGKQISPSPLGTKPQTQLVQKNNFDLKNIKLPGSAPGFVAELGQLWQAIVGAITGHHS